MYNRTYRTAKDPKNGPWRRKLWFNEINQVNMRRRSAAGLAVIQRSLQSWLWVALKISGALLLTAAGVVSFGFSVWAYSVAAGPDHTGMGELLFPTELVTFQQAVRVQPRAWEFRAPYQ